MYRIRNGKLEVYLSHPGGPFCAKKDEGCWSVPKGEIEPGEEFLETAKREFQEETGIKPAGEFIPLGQITQKAGKIVHAWAFKNEAEPPAITKSNLFELEWPPKSGKKQKFPEVDRAEFFTLEEARKKIRAEQIPLIERLCEFLRIN